MTDSLPSGCRQNARLENSLLIPHSQSGVVECLDTLCFDSGLLLGLPPVLGIRSPGSTTRSDQKYSMNHSFSGEC
ncbi:hypothetical protein NPIL_223671 [Nephila pilipes]|uniref:Uncharacterized protein n=1 Tax=Nephila pilipes TaxID=299642 RepID=A0A8X6QAT7_NEPPI|nr:hypothetical protein NPIL_223671 [Nephila pilipes]